MPTVGGDYLLNNIFIEHSWLWLTRPDYAGGYWDAPFFYPIPQALAFSDNLLGAAPLYWALRLFCEPFMAFVLWLALLSAANYAACVWVLKQWKVQWLAGAVASYLFAYGLLRYAQLIHPQLFPQFATPLAFYFLWRFLNTPSIRSLHWLLGLGVYQIMCGIYLGWFLGLALAVMTVASLVLQRSTLSLLIPFFKTAWRPVSLALLFWGLILLAFLHPYLDVMRTYGGQHEGQLALFYPRLAGWVSAPDGSLWSRFLPDVSARYLAGNEQVLWPGLAVVWLVIVAAFGMRRFRESEPDSLLSILLISAVILWSLTVYLGPEWSLWTLVSKFLPGAGAIRFVARLWCVWLFLGVSAGALALSHYLRAVPRPKAYVIGLGILAFLFVDQAILRPVMFEKKSFEDEARTIAQLIQGHQAACLLLEDDSQKVEYSLKMMWAGGLANVPVMNGHTGFYPKSLRYYTLYPLEPAQVIARLPRHFTGRLALIGFEPTHPRDMKDIHLTSSPSIPVAETRQEGGLTRLSVTLPMEPVFGQDIRLLNIEHLQSTPSLIRLHLVVRNESRHVWNEKTTYLMYYWTDAKGEHTYAPAMRKFLTEELSPGRYGAAVLDVLLPAESPGQTLKVFVMEKGAEGKLIPHDQAPGCLTLSRDDITRKTPSPKR